MLDESKTNAPMHSSTRLSIGQGIKWVFVCLVLVALFIVRILWLVQQEAAETLVQNVGATVELAGTVTEDPDHRTSGTRAVVEASFVGDHLARGRTLVVLPPDASISYGSKIVVRGKLELPQTFLTNTGHTFDYPSYLRVRGVSVVMQRARVVDQTAGGFSFIGVLYDLKHVFEKSLERVLPQPQSSLLEGILLGERGGFPPELLQAFVIVGLIHIVVLSGSNIAIVAEGIFRFLWFLPRKAVYVVGGITIVLFAVMVGGGAATLRAVIMASIAILARYLHRRQAALRALVVAAVAMLLWNPLALFDNGFVLSVLATFGLITLAPYIETKIIWIPAWKVFNIRSIVATTLAVEVLILPALLYFSGVLSFVSIPINALVLPFVSLIMFFGFVTGMLGLVHPMLALVPALVTDILLRALIYIAQLAAQLPAAYTVVPQFSLYVVLLAYVPIIALAILLYRRSASLPHPN